MHITFAIQLYYLHVHLSSFIEKLESTENEPNSCEPYSRKIAVVKKELSTTQEALNSVVDDHDDTAVLKQYLEQLHDHKLKLARLKDELLSLSLDDNNELILQHRVLTYSFQSVLLRR